jgi:hypothetical protein
MLYCGRTKAVPLTNEDRGYLSRDSEPGSVFTFARTCSDVHAQNEFGKCRRDGIRIRPSVGNINRDRVLGCQSRRSPNR